VAKAVLPNRMGRMDYRLSELILTVNARGDTTFAEAAYLNLSHLSSGVRSNITRTKAQPLLYATVTEWPTMALKFLRMLLYRGSCDCTRPTSSLARDIRVYVPFWRTSQR
jgi:hypothetical protein